MSDAPAIHARTAAQLREQLARDLRTNVPEWQPVDTSSGRPDQASAALIGICARFGEIVAQRLNQVPHKNFLAFLDLLGVAPSPPQPARVPLTFTLSAGSVIDAVVPAGTQVAAPPVEGDSEPVLFEVERELSVVAANPQALIAVDAERDMLADHSGVLSAVRPQGTAIFSGDRSNEHLLYFGHAPDLTPYTVTALTLTLALQSSTPPATSSPEITASNLQWEAWDGVSWVVLANVAAPANLNGQFRIANPPRMPATTVNGLSSHWLRCRLLKPISPGTSPAKDMLQERLLPQLTGATLQASLERRDITPDAAFANNQALDLTKPFMPFGERPKLGDAFYLGSREGFGLPDATATLTLSVVPEPPLPAGAAARSNITLRWEAWTARGWILLGESSRGSAGARPLEDPTLAFTKSEGTEIRITLPALVPTTINGVTSHWIRAVIVGGDYGRDAAFKKIDASPGFELTPSSLAPPLIKSLFARYSLETAGRSADLIGYNNLEFENLAGLSPDRPRPMFRGLPAQPATLHLAFDLPSGRTRFPNRAISLYHALRSFQYGELVTPLHPDLSVLTAAAGGTVTHIFKVPNDGSDSVTFTTKTFGGAWQRSDPGKITVPPRDSRNATVTVTVPSALPPTASDRGFLLLYDAGGRVAASVTFETRVGQSEPPPRRLRWEYWNGRGWSKLVIADNTDRFARTGIVEFLAPADLASARKFGIEGYWVRALLEPGDAPLAPRLRALVPNTTMAAQLVTLRNEVLGSSDASDRQQFRTARTAVLRGQQLEVREPGPLPEAELAQLIAAHGTDAVKPAGSGSSELWVRWTEVVDLHGTGPSDRHYVLDHLTGQVSFGDGVHGRIPPRGANNIRMARYQTGGGERGNCAAGRIVQLKTTVPYVDKVTNPDAAASGFDAEQLSALVERGPRTLRHGGRAVTADDYEDLAQQASPEVARAKCVPLRRLRSTPLASADSAGDLSVIIVPGSRDPKPLPSLELLDLTASYLRARQAANADVSVVGPLYVRIDVAMEVALTGIQSASLIEVAIRAQLAAFLHPLTGGRAGTGWDFGRTPQLSDLHALVGAVPGVDHVRKLSLTRLEDLAGAEATGRFLVYSGQHQIEFTLA